MTARDLVVLVADKDMQHALKGLLSRPQAMGTRPIAHDIYVHPLHDPACARPEGVQFLSRFAAQYDHGLLLFDHEGSGCEATPAEELQNEIDRRLALSAWGERARAIVLDPELEAWVWSNSPHVDRVTGWSGRTPSLRDWLIDKGWMQANASKPLRPAKAFREALRVARVARSASLYRQIAEQVSLQRCKDRSFRRLRSTLREWFPTG